ncbi:MAG: hypothetical protein K0Q79_3494 [Flavipsychrobacter sp.]|jgi:hypothetical protein|nr:hypothetical protein [Flavipsychrobacter sp.]
MNIIHSFLALAVLIGILFSCKKNNQKPAPPDVSNFSLVDSGTFIPGGRAKVRVNSTTLPDGTYTIYYYSATSVPVKTNGGPATLVMSNHTGTFHTEPLDTPYYVIIRADSIVNGAGGGAKVKYTALFTDSLGMMVAQMNGNDFFKTPGVKATSNGARVYLQGILPRPSVRGGYSYIFLNIENKLGVQNINDTMGVCGIFANETMNEIHFARGEVTIGSLAPLFTGSFAVTCMDSSKMTGTFSCLAP